MGKSGDHVQTTSETLTPNVQPLPRPLDDHAGPRHGQRSLLENLLHQALKHLTRNSEADNLEQGQAGEQAEKDRRELLERVPVCVDRWKAVSNQFGPVISSCAAKFQDPSGRSNSTSSFNTQFNSAH